MQIGSNYMWMKTVGISAALVSAGVLLHLSGPSIMRSAWSETPKLYSSLISWLTPPYLYFVINGIIISIAASSRFHYNSSSGSQLDHHNHHHHVFESPSVSSVPLTRVTKQQKDEEVKVAYVEPTEYGAKADEIYKDSDEKDDEEFVISRSSLSPSKRESETSTSTDGDRETPDYSFLTEKALVSSRLSRRKSLKATPEGGRRLRVSRPKRNDTLESTWKAITDGRAVPLTRHLKKSDTWETHRQPQPEPVVRKCETFTERGGGGGAWRPPVARLRKEASIGQDDLNRRVEAFINKFNEEMRLQRQESFKHYLDMINRGTH